jgi:hypothetical protein
MGMVELVEPNSAAVDESGLAGAWQEFVVHAGVYGEVYPGVLDVMVMPYYSARRWDRIGAASVL